MTPLRLRMIDAMVLRGFAARTQETYLIAVGQMARYHHCSPELLSDEQIQAYLLHLLQERHRSRSTVNITSCAMRFLVCEVLGQTERRPQIPMGRSPQRLPEVLSRAEVAALLAVPMSPKARAFLTTAYASGLRVSELCQLRGCDIDSAPDRMCIRVVQGKGGQDRYGLLTPELLDSLRLYWRTCRGHAGGADWLFPARSNPSRPLDRAMRPALLPPRSRRRRHHQVGWHSYASTLLRNTPAGSGHRPEQHQQVARPCPTEHHQPLPAHGPPRLQRRWRRAGAAVAVAEVWVRQACGDGLVAVQRAVNCQLPDRASRRTAPSRTWCSAGAVPLTN